MLAAVRLIPDKVVGVGRSSLNLTSDPLCVIFFSPNGYFPHANLTIKMCITNSRLISHVSLSLKSLIFRFSSPQSLVQGRKFFFHIEKKYAKRASKSKERQLKRDLSENEVKKAVNMPKKSTLKI